MKPPLTLETQRLSLRKPIAEDAALIFERYAQDPEVTKYMTWLPHTGFTIESKQIDGGVIGTYLCSKN